MLTKGSRYIPFLTAGLLLAGQMALADEWIAEGQLGFGARYSDNPINRPDDSNPQSTAGTTGSASVEFERQVDNKSYSLRPRVTRNWHPDRELKDAEHTNLYLNGGAGISYERSNWNVTFRASDRGILTSEQEDSADFLRVDDTRQELSVSPSATWHMTQKDRLTVATSFSDTDFDNEFNTRFDFKSSSISVFYNRIINARHSIGITALVNQYRSEALNNPTDPVMLENDTDGKSISVNYAYQWSETTRLTLSVGEQSSDLSSSSVNQGAGIEIFNNNSTFESTQYNLAITNETEQGTWNFGAARSVQPSSTGTPAEKWQLSGNYEHSITPSLTGHIKVMGYRQEATGSLLSAVRGETKFIRMDLELSWRVSRRTSLVWEYTFRRRNPESTDFEPGLATSATSNELAFGARYKFGI